MIVKKIGFKQVLFACLMALLALGLLASPTGAQGIQPPEYTGLDIVFLVDQSGSMGGRLAGSTDHPEPNDPQGWRFYALEAAIRQLPALWLTYPEYTARVAIVEFGDRAQVVLPPTRIEARSREDWEPQLRELINRIREYKDERQSRNLGNTNHQAAFRLARKVLDEMEAEDSSPRLKLILMVTDGRPCIGVISETGERGCQPWAPHLVELRDNLIPKLFPAEKDYYIYVVGINDSDDNYWPDTRKYWEAIAQSHGGRAKKVSLQREVGEFFGEALASLLNRLPHTGSLLVPPTPERVETGFYPVPPYLQRIRFMIYKSNPDDWIALEEVDTPLDVTQSSPDGRITVFGNDPNSLYGQIDILRPQPGQWRIEKYPGPSVIVTVQSLLFNPQLLSPVGEHPSGIPARVELNLVDSSGQLVPTYTNPLYALQVTATVRTEDGESEQAIDLVQEKPGVYAGLFVPQKIVPHIVHLRATSHKPDGSEFIVMDQDAGTFAVGPLVVQLDSPREDVYQNVPVRLAYRFLDARGNLIHEVETPEAMLSVEVTVSSEEETQTLTLTREQSGIYSAEYVATRPGPHRVHLLVRSRDTAGREFVVLERDDVTLDVKPTHGLVYQVKHPRDGARDFIRPWWLFPLRPLVVDVEIRDEEGQLVPLSQVISGAPEQSFALHVTDPAGRDRSAEFQWAIAGPGRLQAVGKGMNELGRWTIEVRPEFRPRPGYALTNREPTRLTVIRAEHYLAFGVDTAVVLAILAAIAGTVLHYRAITRPPLLQGVLYVRDSGGNVIWSRPLSIGRNQATFKGRDLPVTTRLKRLSVKRVPGKEEAIEVMATLDNGSSIPIPRMVYKSKRQLGSYHLYLHYDQY